MKFLEICFKLYFVTTFVIVNITCSANFKLNSSQIYYSVLFIKWFSHSKFYFYFMQDVPAGAGNVYFEYYVNENENNQNSGSKVNTIFMLFNEFI